MPSQQEVQWSQLKVGVLVLVALVALAALIFLMSGSTGGIFSRKITLLSYFEKEVNGARFFVEMAFSGAGIVGLQHVEEAQLIQTLQTDFPQL